MEYEVWREDYNHARMTVPMRQEDLEQLVAQGFNREAIEQFVDATRFPEDVASALAMLYESRGHHQMYEVKPHPETPSK
jgi:hypothetical protein